jgi:hypothetical protein
LGTKTREPAKAASQDAMARDRATNLSKGRERWSRRVTELDVRETPVVLFVFETAAAVGLVQKIACLFDFVQRNGGIHRGAHRIDVARYFCGVDVAILVRAARGQRLARRADVSTKPHYTLLVSVALGSPWGGH